MRITVNSFNSITRTKSIILLIKNYRIYKFIRAETIYTYINIINSINHINL